MRHYHYTLLLAVLFLASGNSFAQKKDAGTFYVYEYKEAQPMTPAPAGYEPFYISHFARHGARYCINEYDNVYNWLKTAEEMNLLTEEGKAFFERYKTYYKKVKNCSGNLTGVGKDEHRTIARHMYERFPAVFAGPTRVSAVSTESPRVIMSMWSCLTGLQALDQDLDIRADASAKYCSWLQTSLRSNPYLIKDAFAKGKAATEKLNAYMDETVDWKKLAGRFIAGEDTMEKVLRITPHKFLDTLYGVVSCTWCLDFEQGCFDDLFTPEEHHQLFKAISAGYFLSNGRFEGSENLRTDYAAYTLEQIIKSADADIASGDTQLRLRFGHDSGIAPLFVILDLNGCGREAKTFEEALELYPSYDVPMGANLQLVFFRNAEGDILVKALMNEREATLPLPAVNGIYYRWSDFKEYFWPIIRTSKHKIFSRDPLAALKDVDWGWQPVAGSKAEAASATVKLFGGTQTISMVRFPVKSHAVSVLSSPGPKAAVTSKLGADNKALAAINGSFFDGDDFPITYVKDEGKVVCDKTDGDPGVFNGMFRIQDKKGRKVDILTIDAQSTASAAKGWREAIVSGPVLLEDGRPVFYESDGSRAFRRFYLRRHPRTLIGYTQDGWVYFIVVDGRFPLADGMNVEEMQVLCESLGLYEALNLDGGGSATIWAKDKGVLNHPYDNQIFDHAGERVVPNAIIVK